MPMRCALEIACAVRNVQGRNMTTSTTTFHKATYLLQLLCLSLGPSCSRGNTRFGKLSGVCELLQHHQCRAYCCRLWLNSSMCV